MVMVDKMEPLSQESIIPLDEVLGEAEAKFGPMPPCIRFLLLPHETTGSPTLSDPCLFESPESTKMKVNNSNRHCTSEEDDAELEDSRGEGGICSRDDLVGPPSVSNKDYEADVSVSSLNDILIDLDDEQDRNTRRSPDSGCSMSETSVEDKVSIASTASSSDEYGLSNLSKKIERLRQSMVELREQDVELARKLLTVYDYVEETKWFLENFEACDPRHSICCVMTPSERRFSQNMQKRMSDFGITYLKGIPSSAGFNTPSWIEMNEATPKRHSRNISDCSFSIDQLRRICQENSNNNNCQTDVQDSVQNASSSSLRDEILTNVLELQTHAENGKPTQNQADNCPTVNKGREYYDLNCQGHETPLSLEVDKKTAREISVTSECDKKSDDHGLSHDPCSSTEPLTPTSISVCPTCPSKILHASTSHSTELVTDSDCSIYIVDDACDDSAISQFETHMTWLQEQDETLL
ncbi:uncharacterized protein [Diadema antillarum]|uniref:uncharacterized protein n=1 Tax=Diadema antillarum TaxID=105358 RepID=UPI003A848B0E